MATRTDFKRGGTTGSSAYGTNRKIEHFQLDIAEVVAAGAVASADLITLITIPARSILVIHALTNDTALVLGTSGVVELGDTGDDDRFVANQTTMTADSAATIEAAGAGFTYMTAGTLNLKLSNGSGTITSGKLSLFYELIPLTVIADGKPSF